MKNILTIVIFLSTLHTFSQERDFEILGKSLAESIIKNDSISFHSLILPKEAIIDQFQVEAKDKFTLEEIASTIKNINENYHDIVSSTYGLSFINLTTKSDVYNLNLKNIKYEVVETDETKNNTNIIAIHGSINHDKFSHFTFYASKFKEKLYLSSHLIYISEINNFKERERLTKVKLSSDSVGNLISQGEIKLDNLKTSKNEILNCILKSPFSLGVKETSKTSGIKGTNFEYIKGQWEYTYYVNNSSDYAGIVEFKYELKISDGMIVYKYYDFIHSKDDSEFKSVGILPYELNKTILKVFSEEQYQEIIGDIYLNQVLTVKRTKKYTDKCFE